tara:strand:+ start:1904 stop:4249 length:2346 start_codon:yes stop_codon:yes gene_type:complete
MVKLTNKNIMIIGICLLVLVIILCLLNNSNILSLFSPLKENYTDATDELVQTSINTIEKDVTNQYLQNILSKNIQLKDKDGKNITNNSVDIKIKPFILKEKFYTDILFKILEYKYKKETYTDANGDLKPEEYDNDKKLIDEIKDLINTYKTDIHNGKTMFDFNNETNSEYDDNLNVIFKGVEKSADDEYTPEDKKTIIEYTIERANFFTNVYDKIDNNTENVVLNGELSDGDVEITIDTVNDSITSKRYSNKKDIINSLVTLYTDKLKYDSLVNEFKYMNHLLGIMNHTSNTNGSELTTVFNNLYDTVLHNLKQMQLDSNIGTANLNRIETEIKKIISFNKPEFVSDNIKYIQNHVKLLKVFKHLFNATNGVIEKHFKAYANDTNNAQLKATLIFVLKESTLNKIDTFEDIGKLNSEERESVDFGNLVNNLLENVVNKILYTIEPSEKPAPTTTKPDTTDPTTTTANTDTTTTTASTTTTQPIATRPSILSPNQCVINFGDKVGKHHILSKYSGATYNVEIVEDNLTTDGKAMIIYNKPFREGEHQNDILKLDASGQNLVVGPKNEYGAEDKRERWLIFDDNRIKSTHNLDLALQYDTGYLTIRPIQDYYPEGQKWELKEGPANPGVKSHVSLPVQSLASDGGMMMNQDNISVGLHNQHKAQLSNILSLINSNLQAYQEKTTETENVFGNKEPIKLKLTLSGDTAKYEDVMADKESFKNIGNNSDPTVIDLLNRHQNKSSFASVENDLTRTLDSSNECPKINYNDYYSNRVGQCNCDLTGL